MDPSKELHDSLREVACIGDDQTVQMLLSRENIRVNDQHAMNGWTALHWAAKRGHLSVVSMLLSHGADPTILTTKGETALDLAQDPKIRIALDGDPNAPVSQSELPIVPGYLAYPAFPYISKQQPHLKQDTQNMTNKYYPFPPKKVSDSFHNGVNSQCNDDELVLKVRIAHLTDKDFILIEIPRDQLTFDTLFALICEELQVEKEVVLKLRKLPDIIIRKDKDVRRLKDFEELEIILTSKSLSESSRVYAQPTPRHVDVVY